MKPLLDLAAAPTVAATVPTLTRQEGVRQAIENPLFSRHNGFNLVTLDRARLVGDHLTIANGTRKHLDLYNDGGFFAYATFHSFLCWPNVGPDFELRPKINSLALIEFVYDFALNYERILREHVELGIRMRVEHLPHIRWSLGIRHARFDDSALRLAPYGINTFGYIDNENPAPGETFSHNFETDVAHPEPVFDAGAVAFQLVRPLYNWFDYTDEQIPYTNDERTRIDIQRIIQPG